MDFRIEWPEDEFDWAGQEAKGWLDVTVSWDGGSRVVEVYDPVRLAQSVTGEIARIGRFSSGGLLGFSRRDARARLQRRTPSSLDPAQMSFAARTSS